MFESRSRYDRLQTRPQSSLRPAYGPRREESGHDSSPPEPPQRPTPRPLHANPPILLVGGRRGRALASPRFTWLILALCAVLLISGLVFVVSLGGPELSDRAALPAPPTTPEQTTRAEEPAPPPVRAEPAPSPQPEAVTPPVGETSDGTAVAEQQEAEPPVQATGQDAAQPENTPAPARGFLFINSRPWGRVLIDGRPIGNTPVIRVPIAPGTHELRVERDGFHPFETIVTVDPGADVRLTEIVLRSMIS